MNAVTIVIASMCILAIAYRLYGTFMMVKVLKVNDDKPTPAHALEDGKDYVPTNKWVSLATTLPRSQLAVGRTNSGGAVWLFAGIIVAVNRGGNWGSRP